MLNHVELVRRAIEVCMKGIAVGESPFGAVIAAKEGDVVAAAHNTIRATCDPTAHAEITAIRAACGKLGTTDLTGHVIASTCEPCPMCAAAIHWARLDGIVYGAIIADAQRAGFSELTVSTESLFSQGNSSVHVYPGVLAGDCRRLFELWKDGPHPYPY